MRIADAVTDDGRARASVAVVLLAALALGCPSRPRSVVYDLAARMPVASRWSPRDVLLFGTPAAEPHQAEGFYREAALGAGDPFLWTRREAEVSLTWPEVAARSAIVDMAPYQRIRGQSVVVTLNGREVARFALNDVRHRYAVRLPEEAQQAGENRLRFTFASAASPSDTGDADRRQLAAALYSMVVGRAEDEGLDDLLRRGAPAPFSVSRAGGVPTLHQVGPSVLRYAVRVPEGGRLVFTPALHPDAAAAAARAGLKVTIDDGGGERELWASTLGGRPPDAREIALDLPAAAGTLVRLGLHVAGERFAWVSWQAPRVLGRGADETLAAARSPEEEKRGDPIRAALGRPSVLLIVLDAARADHVGAYGYGRATTPEIDRIAREGVVFERAYTPAAYTLGAMSSLWTSQYPDRHHGDVSFSARLPRDRLTLAELLTAQGVHTAGFVANTVAGGLNGFERGFAEFHEVWRTLGSGAHVFREAVPPFLSGARERPFFAYVHFREPHSPYMPPAPFDTRFGPDAPLAGAIRHDPKAQQSWMVEVNQGRLPLTTPEREHLVRLYDGNLAYADQEVGALRRALEAAGLWDRTVVIVTADHGEALFEHRWIGHNVQLFEPSVRIPLVVRFPPQTGLAGRRVSGLVDLLDVGPTIADVFGVLGKGGSAREFQGRSLLPVVGGAPGKPAVLTRTIWDRPRYGLFDGRLKLIHDTRTGESALYDLQADPGETKDLSREQPIAADYLRQSLLDWVSRVATRPAVAEAAVITKEDCENLKALGYLDSRYPCPPE